MLSHFSVKVTALTKQKVLMELTSSVTTKIQICSCLVSSKYIITLFSKSLISPAHRKVGNLTYINRTLDYSSTFHQHFNILD